MRPWMLAPFADHPFIPYAIPISSFSNGLSMISRCICLSLFLTALSFPLSAASFDCGKSRQASEKLICNDARLSEMDSALASAYSAKLAELSEPARKRYRIGQREWLAYWPRLCANDTSGALNKSNESIECAKREYTARLDVLNRQSRILKGLLVYPVSHYAVMKSTAGVDFIKIAHHTENGLAIDIDGAAHEDRPLADAINRWLKEAVSGSKQPTGDTNDEKSNDTEVDFRLSPSTGFSLVLSATQNSYLFGHGAAHPLSITRQFHFNLSTGKSLTANDIFKSNEWKFGLAHLVEEALKRDYKDDYAVDKFETLADMVANPDYWIFSADGLTVQFNPYDVAPYAAGAPSVMIPWSALKVWLSPGFLSTISK